MNQISMKTASPIQSTGQNRIGREVFLNSSAVVILDCHNHAHRS